MYDFLSSFYLAALPYGWAGKV